MGIPQCTLPWWALIATDKVVAAGGSDGTVLLVSIETGGKLAPFVHGEVCSGSGRGWVVLVGRVGCAAGLARIDGWTTPTLRDPRPSPPASGALVLPQPVSHLCFSASSRFLASASASTLKLWDLKTRKGAPILEFALASRPRSLAIDRSQSRLVVVVEEGSLFTWEILDGEVGQPFEVSMPSQVRCVFEILLLSPHPPPRLGAVGR